MKPKSILLEITWRLARALVYLKRGLVFVFGLFGQAWGAGYKLYKKTLGFAIYKAVFYARRRLFQDTHYHPQTRWYWLGERWALQLIAIFAGLFLIWPQTKAYRQPVGEVPGRKTLLYSLIGSGEQDFTLEDIQGNSDLIAVETNNQTAAETTEIQDWAGTTISGAIVKPYLVSTQLSGSVTSGSINRLQIIEHQIKNGETLSQIASQYSLKVETILWANNLTTRSLLRPGNTLKIPPADGAIHTVKKGETLGQIAKLYGVTTDQITDYNKIDARTLSIGKELLIPGATKVPSTIAVKPTQTTKPVNNQQTTGPVNIPAPSAAVGTYIWPTGAKIITQYYGLRHTGVDIAGPIGLPNYAARDGVVIKSQCGYNGGYGCYIILDHGGGITTLYGHNSKLLVSVGEQVSQGQVIGLLGSTGRSTGPHLHFEVRINGRHTNPLQYIRR